MNSLDSTLCLCGSGLDYAACCGLYHQAQCLPPTAEKLMRSRFTAYALRDEAYLLSTWASQKRPLRIDFLKETAQWQRLEIVHTQKGGEKDDKGVVEFKAYFAQNGADCVMHEISRFIKTDGRWFYVDGVVKSVGKLGVSTNLGKNAPCACGSGKKFKRCCGKSD